jgi:hypothetical protein
MPRINTPEATIRWEAKHAMRNGQARRPESWSVRLLQSLVMRRNEPASLESLGKATQKVKRILTD